MAKCKICGGNLNRFLSLGKQPIANAFLRKEDLSNEEFYFELETGFCTDCKMVQLMNTVSREKLFNENYAYFSSVSKTMEEHFSRYSKTLQERFLTDKDELVIEIGCNDGIMLKFFARNSIRCMGVEPSLNVAMAAQKKGLQVINRFFGQELAKEILENEGKAKLIYAANVICHIESLHDVAKGVKTILSDKGVFAFEEPYMIDILEKNAYDQIYDEHVWFFSVSSLSNFFKKHGLMIFDVERQSTHGGSMRYYVCADGAYTISENVESALAQEKAKGLLDMRAYEIFAENVEKSRKMLVSMLARLKSQNKRIVGYAASSKGTVVLNYCNIGTETLEYIQDNTPTKQGLFSPGKHIPIVPPEEFHRNPPDYALLLAWNYASEIKEKERNSGVKFIVHIPFAKEL